MAKEQVRSSPIAKGADINAKDNAGKTACSWPSNRDAVAEVAAQGGGEGIIRPPGRGKDVVENARDSALSRLHGVRGTRSQSQGKDIIFLHAACRTSTSGGRG